MKRILLFVICLIVPFSCSSKQENTNGGQMRIVSVMPSYTEILFDIGAGDSVVGVSNYCDRPEAAKAIKKVGDYYTPSVEEIYNLKPTVVFISQSAASRLGDDLKKFNLNVIEIPVEKSIDDIFGTIRLIAKETGREKEGELLIRKLIAFIPEEDDSKERIKTYIDVDSGFWTSGKNSFLTDVVKKAGGENVFADVDKTYFQPSWESIIRSQPDFILSVSGNFRDFVRMPLSEKLPAIRKKAILEMDRNLLSRPAPSMFPLIQEIKDAMERPEIVNPCESDRTAANCR